MSTVQTCLRTALALCLLIALAAIVPAAATAKDRTTWICKPGQADDLCAGTIDGKTNPPPGEVSQPLGYTRPANPPIDCFYLYPTQSEQSTPNSNLDKDPEIRRVVVQQARMFSSVCNVYAPMYKQVTFNGDQSADNPDVETAYKSAKSAFESYLENYNDGRGFIMIGHSQGAAHTARLIDETVDTDASLRSRFVGAIAPGANIPVPIGKAVGGMYDHVPACTKVGQYGCVTAFSTYKGYPGDIAEFSRLDSGYWIYPEARYDSTKYEAMCTDPARLDGGDGTLEPLVNFDYLTGVPKNGETPAPWGGQPDYYKVSCQRQNGAHWLDISKVGLPGDNRPDLGALVASGNNYHVPELNLAEGNLLTIAQNQVVSYDKALEKKLAKLKKKLATAQDRYVVQLKKANALKKQVKNADSAAERRAAEAKLARVREQAKATKKKIGKLGKRIAAIEQQLG